MRYYIFVDRNNKPHPKFKAREFVGEKEAWATCPDLRNYILAIGSLSELEKYKKESKSERNRSS